ncbi:hypothetical protein FRC03_008302 [Tulasnella sp. 419]|nr:hypothetical protein FRC03_008302 [Tulasnella sp. 419]
MSGHGRDIRRFFKSVSKEEHCETMQEELRQMNEESRLRAATERVEKATSAETVAKSKRAGNRDRKRKQRALEKHRDVASGTRDPKLVYRSPPRKASLSSQKRADKAAKVADAILLRFQIGGLSGDPDPLNENF